MRILYDGQIYTLQVAGGINRYFANLIEGLPENFMPCLTTISNYHKHKITYPVHPNLRIFDYKRFGFRPGRLSYWLEKYYFQGISVLNKFDVVHPSYYSLVSRQEIGNYRCPVVITVWDMIHEVFSAEIDPSGELAEEKRKAIMAAQAVICISENTKKDLLDRYSIPEDKIKVIYLASELEASLSHGSEPVPPYPYYLYVGSRASYKNFDALLSAFAKVVSVQSDIALCVAGPPFNDMEAKIIENLNLSNNIIQYSYVTDTHLAKLYRCSLALVYPSLYEGFGIPPLEAMSCGTAVIASNSSSIPEVVGDAGLLFDPKSRNEMADILLFLLENPSDRDRLISKGYQRAKLFSWDKTVVQTIDVYRSVTN
jgi:glycosyltransferase involved in cell wall biosynthesis